jgi:AraC-like DNA-binding protein
MTTATTSAGFIGAVRMASGEGLGCGGTDLAQGQIGPLPWSRLRRVLQYIQEHLDQDLPLAQLAAVVYMSPYHFARLFRRTTGMPPHRFVVRKRIEHASTLLATPDLAITRISCAVGFRTPSHFTTVFRRITGLTPSAYRAGYLRDGRPGRERGRDVAE